MKIHRTTDDDYKEIIRNFHESEIVQPVLDRMKLIEDQWRTLNLWEILKAVNPRPIMTFDRDELLEHDFTLLGNGKDVTFLWSILLSSIFEDMMRTLGWKVGDTLDIEEDICEVVGQLLMKVEKQDSTSLLDCMQSAMMNIQVEDSKQYGDNLRTLLIRKKKYNGLNLACILLEQMIIDNKDSNVSWMRIVCAQFIDFVVQLIIEPDYREDVNWTLIYLLKSKSEWKVADVYNLIKNGLLMFHGKQHIFHRYLMITRNFAIPLSLNIRPNKEKTPIELKDILRCCHRNKWRCLYEVPCEEESEKSLDQILLELNKAEIGQTEKDTILQIIRKSQAMLNKDNDADEYPILIERELDRIRKSEQKYGVDVLSSCLAVASMALYMNKKYWPLNTQLVSYCLLTVQYMKGRLLEILTGEGKSCVIAMVAATHALQGRTVDIVTSSSVLSQRDADEWLRFYSLMKLEADCIAEDITTENNKCYECPIVYGTVETFARDILKTEFLLQDVRKGRKCDIVIVDEVDSMLIDQGVQCTYLSHDVASMGLCHFEPILALIWMNVSKYTLVLSTEEFVLYGSEPEVFLMTLSRLSKEIDPLLILRRAEKNKHSGIKKRFTYTYLNRDVLGQAQMLRSLDVSDLEHFFLFVRNFLNLDIDICNGINGMNDFISDRIQQNVNVQERITILVLRGGLSSIVSNKNLIKDRLTKIIKDDVSLENETGINLPKYLKDHCFSRLSCWIDNAFLANEMTRRREYIIEGDAVYPVDYQSTGVVETKKKWGDGLQQFLELKHGLPRSPLSLITNFLTNIAFFERYGSNIIGVSGTLGNDVEKKFMSETFPVTFATIPTSKRRKLFELDGMILENKDKWLNVLCEKIKSVVASQRSVLMICEDIATARETSCEITNISAVYVHIGREGSRIKNVLKPGDVIITTNLGARGTNFVIEDIVNQNGGLFVLITFIPLNDRVEKQAFGRTGRRGATGSCQIIVNREAMPKWLRLCETVDDAKRLRDFIEMNRLGDMTEVNLMRKKQKLFHEYCELKRKFVKLSNSDSDDLKIQKEIIDETWAKWIQNYEAMDHESNHVETVQKLRQIIEDCSKRANLFESDNIHHHLKFGADRLMEGDFEGATKFYDRVIRMDPDWSAFAHYNRAYCTIQIKGDGYIRRAIDDLNATLCRLETYKQKSLFHKIHGNVNLKDEMNNRSADYYIMECQLFHHIDTHIYESIEKLEKIMKDEVTTVRSNILHLIPRADCGIKKMLHEYQMLGLIFSYNVDAKPKFCYMNQIVSSLVMLESVAEAFLNKISANGRSNELKGLIDAACNVSIGWMSRCVSRAIFNGINFIDSVRDVSSLVLINQIEQESSYMIAAETSQFTLLADSQMRLSIVKLESKKQKINTLVSFGDEIVWHITRVAMGVLRKMIEQNIQEAIVPRKPLFRKLRCMFDGVTSSSRSDHQQFVDCIRDLARLPAFSSHIHDDDIRTQKLQLIAHKLVSKSLNDSSTATELIQPNMLDIETAAAEIRIGEVITKCSNLLCDKVHMLIESKADVHVLDDAEMLEATHEHPHMRMD